MLCDVCGQEKHFNSKLAIVIDDDVMTTVSVCPDCRKETTVWKVYVIGNGKTMEGFDAREDQGSQRQSKV